MAKLLAVLQIFAIVIAVAVAAGHQIAAKKMDIQSNPENAVKVTLEFDNNCFQSSTTTEVPIPEQCQISMNATFNNIPLMKVEKPLSEFMQNPKFKQMAGKMNPPITDAPIPAGTYTMHNCIPLPPFTPTGIALSSITVTCDDGTTIKADMAFEITKTK